MQGLAKLLADSAPGCFKEQKFEDYFGRKIAIDASMHIYQFLVSGGDGRHVQYSQHQPSTHDFATTRLA